MNTGFNTSSAPTKCGAALGAPHLITTVDFENPGSAIGTRFSIIGQELGGGDIVGMASMFHVALQTLEFVASRTRPFFADTAFPLTAQEPAALGIGASPHKLGAFRTDDISSIEQSIRLDRHFHDPILEFQHFGPDLFGFEYIFDNHLGIG
jgi:hypothetical protein